MKQGLFVTATDTDVGKTYVSALLVRHFKKEGLSVGYYKPAQSGGGKGETHGLVGDALYIKEKGGLSKEDISVSYCFEEAVSPHLASERQGIVIEKKKIVEDFLALKKNHDFVVVEGAGGICCPLSMGNPPFLLWEIPKALDLEVLIVAKAGLGTINHTLLTVSFIKSQGLTIKGIVLNGYEKGNFLHEDNKRQIETLTQTPVLGVVPFSCSNCPL